MVYLLLFPCLFLLASSTSLPTRGHNPAGGGPTILSDLDMEAVMTRSTRSTKYKRESVLQKAELLVALGSDSVIDCPGNTFTNLDNARAAKESFLSILQGQDLTITPSTCRHTEVDGTLAQICNTSLKPITVDTTTAKLAFDLIINACSSKAASGDLKTPFGTRYIIHARAGEASKTAKRGTPTLSNDLEKRCTVQTQLPVTGCEQSVCDPKIVLDSSGNCPNVGNDDSADGCTFLCEQTASRYYGVAETIDGVPFCSQGSCTVAESTTYTVEQSISLAFGFEGSGPVESVISGGISWSYTVSTSSSLEAGYEFGEGKCGQWYRVPILKHSCSTMSEYSPNYAGGENAPPICLTDAPLDTTTQNCCSEVQSKSVSTDEPNARPDVRNLARWANCADSVFYPDDDTANQNPAWVIAFGSGNNGNRAC